MERMCSQWSSMENQIWDREQSLQRTVRGEREKKRERENRSTTDCGNESAVYSSCARACSRHHRCVENANFLLKRVNSTPNHCTHTHIHTHVSWSDKTSVPFPQRENAPDSRARTSSEALFTTALIVPLIYPHPDRYIRKKTKTG